MLVHRVAVVEVADDQAVDKPELREKANQNAGLVHGDQRVIGERRRQDSPETAPHVRG